MPINVIGPIGIKVFSKGLPVLIYTLPDWPLDVKSCAPLSGSSGSVSVY